MNFTPFRHAALWPPLLAAASLVASPARAELILDDFDDPAEVSEISRGSNSLATVTERIGHLNATRRMSIFASRTTPKASFSSDVSGSSTLYATLNTHDAEPGGQTVISYTASYDFSPMDLTEGGRNDALIFDFTSHHGSQPPTFFRALARGQTASESYAAEAHDFAFSDVPFRTVIPFTSFTFRGGGPTTPNLSTLNQLFVNFYFLNVDEDVRWSVELDKVRIGSVHVPEPRSVTMFGVCLAVAGWATVNRRMRRRILERSGRCSRIMPPSRC